MGGQLIVAAVAARRPDDVASGRHRRSVRNEIEGRGGIVGAQVEQRQVPRTVNPDRVRGRRVETGRRFRRERVLVDAIAYQSERTAGIRRGLDRRIARDRALLSSRGVGDVLLLAIGDRGRDQADRDGAGRGHSGPVEGQALGVGDRDGGGDRAVGGNLCTRDLEHQTRPDEIDGRASAKNAFSCGEYRCFLLAPVKLSAITAAKAAVSTEKSKPFHISFRTLIVTDFSSRARAHSFVATAVAMRTDSRLLHSWLLPPPFIVPL